LKILVIDDSLIARAMLIQLIKEVEPSCEIFEADNGKVGVDILKHNN